MKDQFRNAETRVSLNAECSLQTGMFSLHWLITPHGARTSPIAIRFGGVSCVVASCVLHKILTSIPPVLPRYSADNRDSRRMCSGAMYFSDGTGT